MVFIIYCLDNFNVRYKHMFEEFLYQPMSHKIAIYYGRRNVLNIKNYSS